MDGKKLVLVGVVFLMLAIPVRAEFSYDETTESDCWFDENNLKHCWKALYSGYSPSYYQNVIYPSEDWLEFFDVKYIQIDDNFGIEILEFNNDSVKFRLNVSEEYKKATIPLSWCYDDEHCNFMSYRLNSLTRVYNIGFNPLYLKNITWGLASTTIMLQDANSENLEDDDVTLAGNFQGVYIDDPTDGGASYGYSYIKYNISPVPSGQTIDSAVAYIYTGPTNNFDAGDEIVVYCIDNQTWTEEAGSSTDMIDNQGTAIYSRTDFTDANTWYDFITTTCVAHEYGLGNNNVTFGWLPNDDADSDDDYTTFRTKEYETSSDRPYLNITYSGGAPPTNDYNFTIDLSLNWNDPTNRTLDAVRENDLVITYSDSTSRILSARRTGTLTLGWSDETYATALKIYSRLISLALTWNDPTNRTLDANREVDQTITFTSSGERILTANRLAELSIGWSDETYVKALKIFNRLVSLALGWSDETSRELDAVRTVDQTITFTDIGSRILTANRGASLSLAWSENTYSSLTHFFNRLITLALTWNDPTNRTLDAERGAVQSLTFTGNSERTADMIRQGSLPIGWNDNTYRTLDAVREIDLILTWLDSVVVIPPGAQDFVRIITLLLNLDFDQTTYIKSWESVDPYEICSVLKQIGDSRAYLCVYPDASYKILIRGV